MSARTNEKTVDHFAKEALYRVRGLQRREALVAAWDLLQERDENGNVRGVLPWTDEAVAALQKARADLPNDPAVMHHLAIAHHARAWDYELSDDPAVNDRARLEWEAALGYWYEVAASPALWRQQEDKLSLCRKEADPAVLREARGSLVEDLLDIHVRFVRHYCELGAVDRAVSHIEIVQHANIRPAAKKVLKTKVFKAVIGAVPQAKAARDFEAALRPVELFMRLFADPYLPALEMHASICAAWLAGLSYEHDWDTIVSVAERAKPIAESLAAADELESRIRARTAFEELTSNVARCASDRAQSAHAAAKESDDTLQDLEEARRTYEFAIRWERLGYPKSRDGSMVRRLLPQCLNNYASCLHATSVKVFRASSNPLLAVDAARQQCSAAIEALEEAVQYDPADSTLQGNLGQLRDQLEQLDRMNML